MDWNPESISQEKLHDYRTAAERAWGDDTRHELYVGHPQPSAGQCYVTSRWLTTHLGGSVGVKDGHYFWVSPDRSHVIDLTGDQFAYPPEDPRLEGIPLDSEDEHWEHPPDKKVHRPGPVLFKRADHPLYKGFRVKSFNTENARVKAFRERADAALAGKLSRTADFGWGGDSHPGEEPQVQERMEHDRPEEFGPQHYKWVYANGRLEISPHDDYDYLTELAGVPSHHSGPVALGEVVVHDNRATWRASGNLALSGLAHVLQDHTRTVGWQWGGLSSLEGDQKLARDVWYAFNDDEGLLYLGGTVHQIIDKGDNIGRIEIVGRTATVKYHKPAPDTVEALQEWAEDYKLSLNTTIKTPEDIDGYNTYGPRPDYAQGPTDTAPPTGTLRCPECGQVFPSFGLYVLHRKEEEPQGDELDREDGHFPEMDMDKVLPPHFHDREPRVFPLAKTANKLDAHMDKGWRFSSAASIDFGAYLDGSLVGMATVSNTGDILDVTLTPHSPELVFPGLIRTAARRFDSLVYMGENRPLRYRLRRLGFVEDANGRMVWAKGKEPMDLINDPIPFIFDVDKDQIQMGQPGQNHNAIFGQFTPGGIVQGFYEPGGVVTITGQTDYPWTVRHLVDLWYWSNPHMRVTDVQYEDPMGQKQKLTKTAGDVGQYVKTLAATDPAVWGAYKALEAAGGEVFVVGGAVRDPLMGIEPNDVDLMVTGLHQDQVNDILKKLPGKVDLTGKSFGVFRYNHKGHEVEIALPRTERSTGDRRVDFDVNVDHNLPVEDDLLRRDFTANSMAVSLRDGRLVDPFGGAEDIKNGVLRTTHPASFKEDPTRTLRALVMNARYGLNPDERTRSEMEQHGHRIHNESWMNMQSIMDKLMKAKNPAGAIRLAQETGILKHIIPELASNWDYDQSNPHHNYSLGTHHMHVLEGVQEQTGDPDLRMTALLHDIGKPSSRWTDESGVGHYYKHPVHGGEDHALQGAGMAETRLRHMNWPVARMKRITDLIKHHMFPAFSSGKGARKFLNTVGDHADDLFTLRHADMYGKGTDEWQDAKTPVDDMRRLVEDARTQGAPTALAGLAINGKDLLALGIKPGPQVGQILQSLMQSVIENPELNSREALLALAQGHLGPPAPATF